MNFKNNAKKNLTHSFMRILVRTLKGRVTKHLNNFLVISMMHRNWPIVHLRPYPYMNSTNIRDTYNAQNYQKSRLPKHTHTSKNEKNVYFPFRWNFPHRSEEKKVLLCLLVPIMYHSDAIHTSSVGNRIEKCNMFSCAQRSKASFWVAFVRFLFYSPYILARLFVHRFHFFHFVCSSSLGCMSTAIHLFDSLCVSEWIHLFTLIYTWIFCSQWHSSLSSIFFFPLHFIFVHSFTYFPAFLWTFYSLWYLVSEQYYLLWSLVKHRMSYEK